MNTVLSDNKTLPLPSLPRLPWRVADEILRRRDWVMSPEENARAIPRFMLVIVASGLFYGAILGSYNGLNAQGVQQMLYSSLKVPLLLAVTFSLCLPFFFVFNALLGLRDDLLESLRALAASQAGMSIILASTAPFTALWYASFDNYGNAILFNAAMFGFAAASSQLLLRDFYGPLIRRDRRHRLMLYVWFIVFAFVGVQMGWLFRPFVGSPGVEVQFFRDEMFGDNAYVVIWRLIAQAFGG